MSFLDEVPKCGSSNWNQWDMNNLVDATNAKFPNRISPEMKAELLDVEAQVGESWGPWGAIQRTLFQSLSSAVERKTILNSINAHGDCFCYSRAMKLFRDRFDMYLESGENTTLLEERFKTRIREGIASINDATTFDQFHDDVSQIKRTVEHTPLMSSISDRFICDTLLDKFKHSGNPALSSFAFSMSANPRRHDLDFLFTSIDAILPSSTSSTLPSAAKTTTSADDAPAVFNADRSSWNARRGGGRGRRQGNRGGRPGNPDLQKSNNSNGSGLQALKEAWKFDGSDEAFKRYLVNRRPDGPIDKQFKKMQQELRDLKSKRKLENDVEADLADCSPTKAQRMCFHLETEPSGQEAFLAFTSSPNFGDRDMAEEASEEAQTSDGDESDCVNSTSKPVVPSSASGSAMPDPFSTSSTTRKRRSNGKNGNRAEQKSPKDTKSKDKQKRPKTQSEGFSNSNGWARFNPFRFLSMLFIWFVNCVAGSDERPVETFGEACFKLFIDPFATMFTGLWGNLPRLQNRAVLLSGSAVIAFGVFLMLIFLGGAFSESISIPVGSVYEFPRHSNPNFEVNMLNASALSSTTAHAVGNHGPFRLSWLIDSGASCHLCNDAHQFVNLKPCSVKISTAKAGDPIIAKGVGDVRINTWNESGQPVTINITNVYFVREARRNLLSVRCLAKQRYQTVLPSDAPVFPPGIYDGRQDSRCEQSCIQIECVDGLYFIKTSSVDSDLSNDDPWKVAQRRLGFMDLNALRSLVSRSVGLEYLNDAPFPKNFIDENIRMGKAVNRDKPGPAPIRTSSPLERVSWDLFGPTATNSFGGHKYCAVFVDHQNDTIGCTC